MIAFHRLVLELGHGGNDPETLRQAAGFARLLDAEVHALFVEDETLLHASGLPFAREINPLSMRWRKFAADSLETDLRAVADQARRQLAEAARVVGVRQSFEVRRGDPAAHVTATCIASDIVVVAPVRRDATHESHRFRANARGSAAAVLYLPPSPGPARGPIVALMKGAGDPCHTVAELIATRARERLSL